MRKFEYKVKLGPPSNQGLEAELNKAGDQGWELIKVVHFTEGGQKRVYHYIYWLFSSGKQRAFQCLVYLHLYHEGTLSRMRTEYVIPPARQARLPHRPVGQ